ncbi:3-methyl-2-oxobutanoate hydroxymethyltransferase [Kitasatospora sp. MMS16-BH015]|uniref:isocitrate lyase/PEP mutase family protein n=1 Tax=Kitasatospora sp. MMS16-BH015 TaxID=2018025 RepID=UPI000CA20BD0|nr:isocitrate lyase/phosphoenolpyruvate mutase family protein [Kitasatospora sp. MMS16-BH015]AUG79005.1 3-methyl-2-oxobutanoate hydroxymethyltransferase [Kitasatospora sp. MMS16-BH015]
MTNQHEKARLLHELHRPGTPLVLANVWDAASARLVAEAGAPGIATASASVCWTLGARDGGGADGGGLDRDRAIAQTALIASAVDLPVTADLEDGLAATAEGVAETVTALLATGAVGVNLEDAAPEGGLRPLAEATARIAAARAAAERAGVELFLNARTDLYLQGVGEPEQRLDLAVERALAFVEAGASGVFLPGLGELTLIAAFVKAVPVPVNVLGFPGGPSLAELASAGVARVSFGPGLAKVAYAAVDRAARELYTGGGYGGLEGGLDYGRLNGLFLA